MAFRSRQFQKDASENENPRDITDTEKARVRTMNRALRLLAAKPRSIKEIRGRLLEKDWTNEAIVDGVIEKLCEYKYLDDNEFANAVAVSKLRQKPQGKRRLRMSLYQKKLDKETIESAVETAFAEMPEAELIDAAIEKRIRVRGVPETLEDKRKFYDQLMRRGFDLDLVRSKMEQLARERTDR